MAIRARIKHRAERSAENAVFGIWDWILKQYFGNAKPRLLRSRSSHAYEELDAQRPDVQGLGKWVLRPLVLLFIGYLVWCAQDIAVNSTDWPWILLMAIGVLWFYRLAFHWRLIIANVPLEEGFFHPWSHLIKEARADSTAGRVAVIALAATAFLDLIVQLAGPSSAVFLGWLASGAIVVSGVAFVWVALKLGASQAKEMERRYRLLWEYEIKRIEDLDDELHGRPFQKWHVTEQARLPHLQHRAEIEGYTINDYYLEGQHLWVAVMPVSPAEKLIYDSAATNLGAPVHEITLFIEWVENDEPDRDIYPERIETLYVLRSPIAGITPEKREERLIALRNSLPKASNGWTITDKQDEPHVKVLKYGKPLALPDIVSLEETLPRTRGIAGWSRVPVGKNSTGGYISLNLERVPHMLIAGGTGSGKSTLLRADMVGRLVRGHDIVVIDTVKGANDFLTLKPWTLMWGETITEAANILAYVYEESVRRRTFLRKHKIGNWAKLTPEQREEGAIRPLSVFYDEYENSIVARTAPKSLGKEHPLALAAQAHNIGVDFIKQYMPQLAKEARSVGIHLVVATQTPHSGRIGEDLRANLGGSIQLSNGKLEQHIVKLALGEASGRAMELFGIFDKPKLDKSGNKKLDEEGNVKMMPGLGVALADGGAPTAMRVAFADEPRAPEILQELGVEETSPWQFDDALELGMKLTLDEDDTRAQSQPPFQRMTHLLGSDDPEATEVSPSHEEGPAPETALKPKKGSLFGRL